MSQTNEAAFETVIESCLLSHGYMSVYPESFDRERAIFPETVLSFIQSTQPKEWAKLESLHGASTGEQVLMDLCKWMDAYGSLATLRHGFKCYGRTLRVAFFKAAHAGAFRGGHRISIHDHASGRNRNAVLTVQQGMRRRGGQSVRSRGADLSHGIPVGGGAATRQLAGHAGAISSFAGRGETDG